MEDIGRNERLWRAHCDGTLRYRAPNELSDTAQTTEGRHADPRETDRRDGENTRETGC